MSRPSRNIIQKPSVEARNRPMWRRLPVFAAAVTLALACLGGCSKDSPSPPPVTSPATSSRPAPALPPSGPASTAAPASASAAPAASATTATPPWVASSKLRELTWSWDDTPVGPVRVVIEIPDDADEEHRLPILIAMHGRGEARKGPDKGARGWVDDYWLPKAVRRLGAPPLTSRDLLGMSDSKRLARLNKSLSKRPYQGLIVACPYTPDSLRDEQLWEKGGQLADFLVDQLIPRLRKETPSLDAIGVDGVSLGGRAAWVVGLTRPEAFRFVGSVQAAFDAEDAPDLARRATEAVRKNPSLQFRLLTSDHDYYLEANKAIARAMKEAGVRSKLAVVPGSHGYDFNRGPGVYEMLVLHDRALRGLPYL